jgi:betaine-homocysteine S-methyltransferase
MPDLSAMLEHGPVVCAEGYLFECERRGYLQAGAFVPEVVLDHPDVVSELHREFVHAGSDVVEAFTYYGHRQKLRVVGKEEILEPLNRQALSVAAGVARQTGTLLAGNVCNTNVYEPGAPAVPEVRAAFEEQVAWAAEAGAAADDGARSARLSRIVRSSAHPRSAAACWSALRQPESVAKLAAGAKVSEPKFTR